MRQEQEQNRDKEEGMMMKREKKKNIVHTFQIKCRKYVFRTASMLMWLWIFNDSTINADGTTKCEMFVTKPNSLVLCARFSCVLFFFSSSSFVFDFGLVCARLIFIVTYNCCGCFHSSKHHFSHRQMTMKFYHMILCRLLWCPSLRWLCRLSMVVVVFV